MTDLSVQARKRLMGVHLSYDRPTTVIHCGRKCTRCIWNNVTHAYINGEKFGTQRGFPLVEWQNASTARKRKENTKGQSFLPPVRSTYRWIFATGPGSGSVQILRTCAKQSWVWNLYFPCRWSTAWLSIVSVTFRSLNKEFFWTLDNKGKKSETQREISTPSSQVLNSTLWPELKTSNPE